MINTKTPVYGKHEPGNYEKTWQPANLQSGLYFHRLPTGNEPEIGEMVNRPPFK